MSYSYVSAYPRFYPFSLPMALSMTCLVICGKAICLDSEPLHFASKSVEFWHASLYRWSLKDKLTLDLSRYIWASIMADTSCCNFFPHC